MNLQHLFYAVEVARCRSITKAAEQLFLGQPNLSRAIRELEEEIGIPLFLRTPSGMLPTAQGQEFLLRAETILDQVQEIRALGHPEKEELQLSLTLTVPRASYIAHAFTKTIAYFDSAQQISVNYGESNTMQAVNNLLSGVSSLAIIRYFTEAEPVIAPMLKNAGIASRPVMDFTPVVLLSRLHPLAGQKSLPRDKLLDWTEILHGDPFIPSLVPAYSGTTVPPRTARPAKSIYIYERGSQFDLLRDIPSTFMWVSPMPQLHLDCNSLVQLCCLDTAERYRDLLIYRRGHNFSPAEKIFCEMLEQSIRHVLSLTQQSGTNS